jgi:transcriptional regulator with XRE-family HTH domain
VRDTFEQDMTDTSKHKTLFINKEKRVHSELFDEVRLTRGLSRFRLAVELELSPQTIRRVLTAGEDPRPATVKKIGEYLGIPAHEWYIQREDDTNDAS